jgi:hypothetical protein
MQVLVGINLPTDQPHWVAREDFYRYFDQDDFNNRDIKDVQSAYLEEWFHEDKEVGITRFMIPVVGAIGENTDLISSRHRLAVLLPHLEELPIAFQTAHLTPEARRFLESIPKRPLDETRTFWIPDFLKHNVLPWPPM